MSTTCLYKQIHPPTAVTQAASGYVTHTAAQDPHPNLVVSRGTEVQIYQLRTSQNCGKAGSQVSRLELVCSYSLSGAIESLSILKGRSVEQVDAVLLTFRDAKLSVLEWEVGSHQLRISSLHSFEGEPALRKGKRVFSGAPLVLADHLGRFAAVIMYDNQLAVLPAVEADFFAHAPHGTNPPSAATTRSAASGPASQALVVHTPDQQGPDAVPDEQDFGSAAAVGNSYVLDLTRLGETSAPGVVDMWGGSAAEASRGSRGRQAHDTRGAGRAASSLAGASGIQEVRDAVLLHGYNQPVMLVLHQPDPSWVGRLRERKDTCAVSAVSLSIRRKKHSVLWFGAGLPADSLKLVAVPGRPLALLLTPCAIIVCQQGSRYGVAVSSKAVPGNPQPRIDLETVSEAAHVVASRTSRANVFNIPPEVVPAMYRGMQRVPDLEADLRGAQACWLGSSTCLISCTSGQQLSVVIKPDSPMNQRIQVSVVQCHPSPPPASCLVDLGEGHVFLGSVSGDSLLLKKQSTRRAHSSKLDGPAAKRARHVDEAGGGETAAGVKTEGGEQRQEEAEEQAGGSEDEEQQTEGGDQEGEGEGDEAAGPKDGTRFSLKCVDSLMGCGPVRDVLHLDTSSGGAGAGAGGVRGGPTVFAAAGGDRSSGVVMLRPGLIPDLVTEVGLAGITGMWAIHHRRDEVVLPVPEEVGEGALVPVAAPGAQAGQDAGGDHMYHAYLLMTHGQHGKTMVLETGEELQEITHTSTYITNRPTLSAGNLFNLAGICQITPEAVFVFDGPDLMQELAAADLLADPPAQPVTITAAQVQDPFVFVLLSNGQAVLMEGDDMSMTLNVSQEAAQKLGGSGLTRITAGCLIKDETGWLAGLLDGSSPAGQADVKAEDDPAGVPAGQQPQVGQDVDMSDAAAPAPPPGGPPGSEAQLPAARYLAVVREDGLLCMHQLPGMSLVYCGGSFGSGVDLLLPQPRALLGHITSGAASPAPTRIVELCVESFQGPSAGAPPDCERPVLVGLTATGTLLVYQAFDRGQPAATAAHLAAAQQQAVKAEPAVADVPVEEASRKLRLGWKRLPVEWVGHQENSLPPALQAMSRRLARFDRVAWQSPDDHSTGPLQSGVFLGGARPLWLVAARGGLVPHPMYIDGAVTALTPFHNINCPYGFIMSCTPGCLKVGHMPTKQRLDTPWTTRKVRLPGAGTVHRLAHVKDLGMLAVAASRQVPSTPWQAEAAAGEPHAVAAYAGAVAAAEQSGTQEMFEVRLLQLPQLTPAPGLRPIMCEPGESLQGLKQVSLKESPTSDNMLSLLALGTAFTLGEDYPCLGRIAVYQFGKTHTGGGAAAGTWSATLLASRETAGPVITIQEFKGMLLAAVGKHVELYSLKPASSNPAAAAVAAATGGAGLQHILVKTAFFDCPVLITSIAVVKDFLLVGDAHQGCMFLRYNDAGKVLELLSKDFEYHDVVSANYVINASKLLFAVADASCTLRQFEYARAHPASWGGQRLVSGGTFHIGHMVTRLTGVKMPTADGANRHGLLVSTVDGAWGFWGSVWDASAATRLLALQRLMVAALPQPAGLNPRAFRRRHLATPRALGGGDHWGPQLAPDSTTPPPGTAPAVHAATGSCILDGDLLWRFALLPRGLQQKLAAQAGAVTVEQVLMDLTAWITAVAL